MPDAALQRKLRNWQMLLLDLTRANRLLYFKVERGSSVPMTSPTSADLFQLLVTQGKQLKFPAADQSALFEEEDNETPEHPEEPEAASLRGASLATRPICAAPLNEHSRFAHHVCCRRSIDAPLSHSASPRPPMNQRATRLRPLKRA